MTVKLVDAAGAVVGVSSGEAPQLKLALANLAAGAYRYVVTGVGYKGAVGFTLTVTAPAP